MFEGQAILQTPIHTHNSTILSSILRRRWLAAMMARLRAIANATALRRLDERQREDAGILPQNASHHARIPVDGALMRRLMSLC